MANLAGGRGRRTGRCTGVAVSEADTLGTRSVTMGTSISPSDATATDGAAESTGESEQERLDREHEQLFHELRSIVPGVQVQTAFLLTVAFTDRFRTLTEVQRDVYYATFVLAAASLVLLFAPAAFHRVQFRQRDKEVMIRAANVEVIAALVLISLSLAGTVFLITDLMFPTGFATVAGIVTLVVATGLWWGFPLTRRVFRRAPATAPTRRAEAPSRPATSRSRASA